jgi:leader peptidase (prepilin peptidase)/N-methyltransferase
MDYFLIAYGALLLALSFFFGKYGSLWIDRLYLKNHSILSFPDAIGSRAKYRVKLLTLLFFLTGIRLFFVSQGIILVLSLALCGLLLLIIVTDFEQYCIFNDMIIPLAAGGALCSALFLPIAIDHLIAAAAGGVLFLIIAILSRGALGGGDIKLIACLGLWLGTDALFAVSMIGIILGGLVALLLLLTGKKKRKSAFAYGPYFALTTVALFLIRGL